MFVRIMTLHWSTVLEAFDEGPLQEFVKDKRVLSVRDHFFIRDSVPYLTIVLTWDRRDEAPAGTKGAKGADESWREWIKESDYPLFNTLRNWRAETAKANGIPPFIICTNRQLAEIVNLRPESLSAFSRVNGFGKAKIEKYGKAMVDIFRSHPPKSPKDEAKPGTEERPAPNGKTAKDNEHGPKKA